MKFFLLLLLQVLFIFQTKAQFFPFQQVTELPYYWSYDNHERVMIRDSFIYECRDGCVQIMNVFTGESEYRWKNHYQSDMLFPYKHDNYVLLRSFSFISVYDSILQDYKDIDTGPLTSPYIPTIGVSPNGNIWANSYSKIGIYNGTTWQTYPYNSYGTIKVIDDTSAYVSGNPFYRFHNGIYDTLFSLPAGTNFRDWDTDSLGNLWIAGKNKLIYAEDTTMVFFDSTNTPIGSDNFTKVVVGTNGHVWTCGVKGKLLEYDGANWFTRALPSPNLTIDNFNLDSLNRPWVIAGYSGSGPNSPYMYMSVYIWNGINFNSPVDFPFMPYINIKAISPNALATDDGVFVFNPASQNFRITNYRGYPERPEAIDVNCFRTFTQYTFAGDMAFGTNDGIYNYSGIVTELDSSVLPNDTVNYIYDNSGSDYVCTNNGLLIYNGVFYNTLDTSNSPLPSNKITFAIVAQALPYNKLYIGTDNGIAIYMNNQWTVFDSTYFGLSSCNVTGILPAQYWDTTIYITTMGSGLIKLYDTGLFDILNTSNGNFLDDSLYYAIPAELGDCGSYILIGTNEHGLATFDYWNNDFFYYNDSTSYDFRQSRAAVDNIYSGGNILMGTDNGIWWASPCGGINDKVVSSKLMVYPNPSAGIFTVECPEQSQLEIHNILGELIYTTKTTGEKTTVDLRSRSKGMYFIRLINKNQISTSKKLILY